MGEPLHSSSRGPALLELHVRSFDPYALTATERLYAKIGRDLGRKLVFALVQGGVRGSRAA
ncbi:MAG: hypothetical protein JOZ56_10480 [Actinobacteria bacterium]|nr:hypothetical protein [Actinomycetota bacterium]MBV8563506.1 hypothetical protein [Actinomycetota bacterium]